MKIVLFVCGHVGSFKAIRDDGYCLECETWRDVREEWPEQWWSSCKRCPGSKRAHGHARVYAERRAAEHQARTGHRMDVRYYSAAPAEVTAKITKRSQKQELPLEPPF